MSLDLVPLRRERANAFVDSRKLLGVRNKLYPNEIDLCVGGDIVGIETMRKIHRGSE
jgi:hypothetical protein